MDDEKYYDDVISRVNRKEVEEVREDVIVVDDSEVEEDYNLLACAFMLILFIAFFWDKGIGYVRF